MDYDKLICHIIYVFTTATEMFSKVIKFFELFPLSVLSKRKHKHRHFPKYTLDGGNSGPRSTKALWTWLYI